MYFSCSPYITGAVKTCGKWGHEGNSWRLPCIRRWWGGFHISWETQKKGVTMELVKGGVGFSLQWNQKDTLVDSQETWRPNAHAIQVYSRCKQGTTTGWHWRHQFQSVTSKLHHAFIFITQVNGLFSLVNRILVLEPKLVLLQQNQNSWL